MTELSLESLAQLAQGSMLNCFASIQSCIFGSNSQILTEDLRPIQNICIKVLQNWMNRVEVLGYSSNADALVDQKQQIENIKVIFGEENSQEGMELDEALQLPTRRQTIGVLAQVGYGYWLIGQLHKYSQITDALYDGVFKPVLVLQPCYKIALALQYCISFIQNNTHNASTFVDSISAVMLIVENVSSFEGGAFTAFNVYAAMFPEFQSFSLIEQRQISSPEIGIQGFLTKQLPLKANYKFEVLRAGDRVFALASLPKNETAVFDTGCLLRKSYGSTAKISTYNLTGNFSNGRFVEPCVYIVKNDALEELITNCVKFSPARGEVIVFYYLFSMARNSNQGFKLSTATLENKISLKQNLEEIIKGNL